ncbi:MAG: nucleoside hydrolase [Planctomycetota bacterium]
MTRKIILDCDPGIDDGIALILALFDPRLEVMAITPTAGTVDAEQATTNVTAIIGKLDPVRYPRQGRAFVANDTGMPTDAHLNGTDGLANSHFPHASRQHDQPSDKVITDLIRRYPGEITLVCLGPLSNLARVCQRDPSALPLLDKVVISGGAVSHAGNATAVAERNFYFDPVAARTVMASPITKSLVPLDVAEAVTFGVDLLDQLPSTQTRAGELLHKWLSFAFRVAHQRLGRETIALQDALAVTAVTEPEWFQWQDMAGDVEVAGNLTRGMSVFDRRLRPEWQTNMEVARRVNVADARDAIVRGLRYAGQQTC